MFFGGDWPFSFDLYLKPGALIEISHQREEIAGKQTHPAVRLS